jgi:hypothetical protein
MIKVIQWNQIFRNNNGSIREDFGTPKRKSIIQANWGAHHFANCENDFIPMGHEREAIKSRFKTYITPIGENYSGVEWSQVTRNLTKKYNVSGNITYYMSTDDFQYQQKIIDIRYLSASARETFANSSAMAFIDAMDPKETRYNRFPDNFWGNYCLFNEEIIFLPLSYCFTEANNPETIMFLGLNKKGEYCGFSLNKIKTAQVIPQNEFKNIWQPWHFSKAKPATMPVIMTFEQNATPITQLIPEQS